MGRKYSLYGYGNADSASQTVAKSQHGSRGAAAYEIVRETENEKADCGKQAHYRHTSSQTRQVYIFLNKNNAQK